MTKEEATELIKEFKKKGIVSDSKNQLVFNWDKAGEILGDDCKMNGGSTATAVLLSHTRSCRQRAWEQIKKACKVLGKGCALKKVDGERLAAIEAIKKL